MEVKSCWHLVVGVLLEMWKLEKWETDLKHDANWFLPWDWVKQHGLLVNQTSHCFVGHKDILCRTPPAPGVARLGPQRVTHVRDCVKTCKTRHHSSSCLMWVWVTAWDPEQPIRDSIVDNKNCSTSGTLPLFKTHAKYVGADLLPGCSLISIHIHD